MILVHDIVADVTHLLTVIWKRKKQGLSAPNGLAFSCRERAGKALQNANDLAREAVSCNAVLAGTITFFEGILRQ
jgi:hypothetical protein